MDTFTEDTVLGPISISEDNGKIISLKFRSDGSEDTMLTDTLSSAFDQLNEYISGKRMTFDLELDPKGTDFQKDVWKALTRIPYGTVIGYGELARSAGHPNAHRAAGNANGRNPIPIFIPCHRVIRSDGTIGGYSSGIDIKRRLLEIENIIL